MENLPHIPSPPIAPGFYLAEGAKLALLVAAFLVGCLSPTPGYSRPSERWAQASPERKEFFEKAHMPDSPRVSCCGKADAYEADDIDDDGHGHVVAILTCSDPENCVEHDPICDEEGDCFPRPLPGTRIVIPTEKVLKPHQPDNFSGHGWVFLSAQGAVYCYAFPGLY